MDTSELILMVSNSLITIAVLMITIRQRNDSRKGVLVGTLEMIRKLQDENRLKLKSFMELSANRGLLQKMSTQAKEKCIDDVKQTLARLAKLDECYNTLVAELDNDLDQKGLLLDILKSEGDKNPKDTIEMFKVALTTDS